MNRFILTTAIVFFASSAFAQDSMIRIVGDDGSVQELDLATPRGLDPIVDPVEVAPEPELVEPEIEAMPEVEPKAEPQEKPQEKPKAEPKPAPVKKAKAPSMIVPPRKPRAPLLDAASSAPVSPVRAEGAPLSRAQALAIALEGAPPARRVVAVERNLNGRPVFLVTFHTDNDPYEVVVDALSGDIVR